MIDIISREKEKIKKYREKFVQKADLTKTAIQKVRSGEKEKYK